MKEYLLLFWNATGDGAYDLDPEKMEEGMKAWQSWIGNIATQGKLVSTKPIQWEGSMVSNDGLLSRPTIKEGEMVTGYLLCKAENREEVEEWSKTCPILSSPAGFTEIREVMPFTL